MIAPSRVSLLHLVGVDGVLLVVCQNAVLFQVIGVAGVPERIVELAKEARDVRGGERKALRVRRVEVAGLVLLNMLRLHPPIGAVGFLGPLKVLDQAVAELVGYGVVVHTDEIVVLYLDGHLNFGPAIHATRERRVPLVTGVTRCSIKLGNTAAKPSFLSTFIGSREARTCRSPPS